jgi:dihydroorotate dehydrogenase (fumarate)
MEINLSCPNIPNLPPPAYSPTSLASYFEALPSNTSIPIGIKIPPYTHAGQFDSLISSLLGSTPTATSIPASKLSFLTATKTLGSCILLDSLEAFGGYQEALPGEGIGGMAGPPLHPLALGNVATLRRRFDQDPRLAHLEIIGVGGVYNGEGYNRMRHVGARAVGIATALGRRGVQVFTSIEDEIKSVW